MKLNIDFIYPIGSIYMTVSSTNPQVLFGGTWTRVANGRCLVGVDTSQSEFDRVEKTGGEKTHQLVMNEMPSHTHNINRCSGGSTSPGNDKIQAAFGDAGWLRDATTTSSGGNQAHNNLQPYYCVYIWKRTA